ncbi:putative hydrolase [Streptomyces tauricus]|uniref:Alpha/beta fold hydrolase n=1 Tax=Streptomyces tauricus TaxID=68274 RepID=A0ABZ1JW55_9ACTN|nr:alpha/beta fold hydrolase [Streptomyces tauricus]GHA45448.1 putative hydrolase [Streptomyces tauricus]
MSTYTPPPHGIHERQTQTEGRTTVYLEAGTGPDLLLLHGDASGSFDWIAVIPQLAATHHVIALDMPGFGRTPPLDEHTPARYTAFVEAFVTAIGLKDYSVIGHSFGGMIAIHLALVEENHINRLVLVAPGGLGRSANPVQTLAAYPVLRRAAFAASMLPGAALINTITCALGATSRPWNIPPLWYVDQVKRAESPQYISTTLAVVANALTPFGQRYDLRPKLPHLPMPSLVVWGILDFVVPAWQAASASLLPQGSRRLMATGHCPQLEAADEFLKVVRPFLNSGRQGTDEQEEPAASGAGKTK